MHRGVERNRHDESMHHRRPRWMHSMCTWGDIDAPTVGRTSPLLHSSGPPQLIKRKLDGKSLEAFGLFKKGVKPEWEDPVNVQVGG